MPSRSMDLLAMRGQAAKGDVDFAVRGSYSRAVMHAKWLLLTVVLASCGGREDMIAETGSGAGAASPSLEFTPDWHVLQSAPLLAGDRVVVRYNAARLPDCRGDISGGPAWTITAFASVNGGAAAAQPVFGRSPDGSTLNGVATFDVPSAGELAIWFQVTNRWGCSAYDSDYGKNFRFPILAAPSATIRFFRDWSETVSGRLTGGTTALLDYDLARLPSCRQTYNGYGTWDVLAYYRFDGGAVTSQPVTAPNGMDRAAVPARINVPAGARELEAWFQNSDRAGCVAWDSDFGANYHFRVE